MKNMKLLKLLLLFGILFSSYSCTSVKLPPCLSEKSQNTILRWGEFSSKSSIITYYELKSDKSISLAIQQDKNSEPKLQTIGKISDESYCRLLKQTKTNILLVQALNVPSETANFLEYIEKENNLTFRAVWNPKHDNKGNKEFKELFAQLQEAVGEAGK
jgi:hypothetical protein